MSSKTRPNYNMLQSAIRFINGAFHIYKNIDRISYFVFIIYLTTIKNSERETTKRV